MMMVHLFLALLIVFSSKHAHADLTLLYVINHWAFTILQRISRVKALVGVDIT